jgi:hypothetical protein
MTNTTPTLTFKAQSFYVAYAPEAGILSYGSCFEEAANGLAEQLRCTEAGRRAGEKGTSHEPA